MAAHSSNGIAELRALANLINSSIDDIERAVESHSGHYPSLNESLNPKSENVQDLPAVAVAGDIIVSAASQLIATARNPLLSALLTSVQFHVSSALRVAITAHTVEVLKEAGPKGLHVSEIATFTKIDPKKLARVLRLLVANHIFTELSPDVFSNNRISSAFDSGKSVAEILKDPQSKYDNSDGLAAVLAHSTDEVMKSSSYLSDVIFDPTLGHSNEPNHAAFNRAFGTDLSCFPWFDLPENQHRLRRFGIAMRVGQKQGSTITTTAFDWQSLPEGSIVVDVGGGIGSMSLALAKQYSKLRLIVQDRAATIQDGRRYWESVLPEAINSGQVEFQAHDFFDPQPVKSPAVFFMRRILHDWPDDYCVRILKHLRTAAGPGTKLVICDLIVQYASAEDALAEGVVGDTSIPALPAPLSSNGGAARMFPYLVDMQMLTLLNGAERTVPWFAELFGRSGWKLVKFHRDTDGNKSLLVGVPA